MDQVSRPMQIALLATVLLAVVWLVALRPKPASVDGGAAPTAQEAPSAPGTEGLQRAVDQANGAADAANADGQRAASSDAEGSASEAGSDASAKTGAAAAPANTSKQPRATAQAARRAVANDPTVRRMRTALRQRKAIAIAFVAPSVADARAVAGEIRQVSSFGGRAVSVAVPIADLSRFGFITRGVDVTVAPTTLIIAPNHEATTIVGFTERVEIEQRLADALARPRH